MSFFIKLFIKTRLKYAFVRGMYSWKFMEQNCIDQLSVPCPKELDLCMYDADRVHKITQMALLESIIRPACNGKRIRGIFIGIVQKRSLKRQPRNII